MSLQQTNTSVARTRSLRVPAKAALTAPRDSTTTANNSIQVPTSTSNVLLFLTNLRLLDLDLEPDWPGITPATFSAKDAAGGQKKRIQSVEWALYQLFLLWDHEEAQNKLRPYFPPLDQVQSINLRSALLRSLEQAKKNGVLGRDAVVRKTMLDECKGDRLEEVLAVFSSAVLKKLVAERALNGGLEVQPTISERISLENWGYTGDRTELNALLLSYKICLTSILVKKSVARERYKAFETLLASKERNIAQRKEQAKNVDKQKCGVKVSEAAKEEVRKALRTNWTGNDRWIDALLFNDTHPHRGGLLGTPFDEIWSDVETGKVSDIERQSSGLLEQLDERVRLQKARLEKWNGFREKMFGDQALQSTRETEGEVKSKGIGLEFKAHQNLTVGPSETERLAKIDSNVAPEYATLLENMKAKLDDVGKTKIPNFANLLGNGRTKRGSGSFQSLAVKSTVPEPISDLSELEDEIEEDIRPPPKPLRLQSHRNSRRVSVEISPPQPPPQPKRQLPRLRTTAARANRSSHDNPDQSVNPQPLRPVHSPEVVSPAVAESQGPEIHLQGPSGNRIAYPEIPLVQSPLVDERESMPPPPERPVSPTQALADEILASMSNASPSPTKKPCHTLSLVERTRMSMSRVMPFDQEEDEPGSPERSSPVKTSHSKTQSEPIGASDALAPGEEYEDLVARTRRSMAGYEAARQKAQLERRRSQRQSKLPPRKDSYFPRVEEEGVDDTSVIEELISAPQEDMEAVFRSRPRIKTSPAPDPNRKGVEE